jgi:hypothetical protein
MKWHVAGIDQAFTWSADCCVRVARSPWFGRDRGSPRWLLLFGSGCFRGIKFCLGMALMLVIFTALQSAESRGGEGVSLCGWRNVACGSAFEPGEISGSDSGELRWPCCGMLRHIVSWKPSNVSEALTASPWSPTRRNIKQHDILIFVAIYVIEHTKTCFKKSDVLMVTKCNRISTESAASIWSKKFDVSEILCLCH